MDPNLFHVDWEQLIEALAAVVVLSFVVERALALVFEHRLYVNRLDDMGLKEPIAFALALVICVRWDFDIVSVLLRGETTTLLGQAITAAVIAGGSKASIKLFHDVLGVRSRTATAKAEARLASAGKTA